MSTKSLARTRPAARHRRLKKQDRSEAAVEQKEVHQACLLVAGQLKRWAADPADMEQSWWRRRWWRRLTARAKTRKDIHRALSAANRDE
jgi:hypothetical protein